jgi:hypothetical protein
LSACLGGWGKSAYIQAGWILAPPDVRWPGELWLFAAGICGEGCWVSLIPDVVMASKEKSKFYNYIRERRPILQHSAPFWEE